HRRRLSGERRKPIRFGGLGGPAHAPAHEGQRPARALEEQGLSHGAPRNRSRQSPLRAAESRSRAGVHRRAESPRVRLRRGGGQIVDRELRAGSHAHYEDPTYYANTYAERVDDVAFYAALARSFGGPVLEYGVGNGRIALPIAREGVEVVGVDWSRPM